MNIDLKTLIEKLNGLCRKTLEETAAQAMGLTHFSIEIEHYLRKLLENSQSDFFQLLRYYDVSQDKVLNELTLVIEGFKRGNTRNPTFSPQLVQLFQEAYMISTLLLGNQKIRSGALLLALLDVDLLRGIVVESAPSLLRINKETLRNDLKELLRTMEEGKEIGGTGSGKKADGSQNMPSLDQFTIDLTARARAGEIDPIRGRDMEIRQIMDILLRRRQNNPILTGEAGVGKTAVVEGFAQRVVDGDVPTALKNVSVRILDLGLLQAGAGIKGEFENRLKMVINEVKSSPQPIIMFIDEAHMIIGAGGPSGQADAANLLKPALARGELRTIAATTWSEYKKYFEKDPALSRRFQVVKIEEPSENAAIDMVRGLTGKLEAHHKIVILDEAVIDSVRLSHRYITGRHLPDKAIGALDTACARVAGAQNTRPAELENLQRRLEQNQIEYAILSREHKIGMSRQRRIDTLLAEQPILEEQIAQFDARWQKEAALVKELQKCQEQFITDSAEPELRDHYQFIQEQLLRLQDKNPLVPVFVDGQTIARVISDWTGIPLGKMVADELRNVINLERQLQKRIIGQSTAIASIYRRIQTSRADLVDPNKPIGVFLLVGPSGVGKTESAIALADILYGTSHNLITINMSEYKEAYTISGLKGSPPGYVGYGQGGVLTEPVRHNPYSIVLLDEVEKAHPDVLELFYQVFDKGILEDAEGIPVNFKNCIIIMTSNLCSQLLSDHSLDLESEQNRETVMRQVYHELRRFFKPAFLGRLSIVPYLALNEQEIRQIAQLKMQQVVDRLKANHKALLKVQEEVYDLIIQRCTEVDSGARNIDHILNNSLLPELSATILDQIIQERTFNSAIISVGENQQFVITFQS